MQIIIFPIFLFSSCPVLLRSISYDISHKKASFFHTQFVSSFVLRNHLFPNSANKIKNYYQVFGKMTFKRGEAREKINDFSRKINTPVKNVKKC